MKVEIWSDIMCPFCYIGKRKFEMAIQDFEGKDQLQIEWKAFQLAPNLVTQPGKNIHQYLAEIKNMPLQQAKGLNDHVTTMAKQVGLTYNFEKAIVANSFRAHRFSHLAKQYNLQNEAEEKLFAAYFTLGKNIDDVPTLVELGMELGLKKDELLQVLEGNKFTEEVNFDIQEARLLGVRGVPFFVFDRKYAVSGAQDTDVIRESLEEAFKEWETENQPSPIKTTDGPACSPDTACG